MVVVGRAVACFTWCVAWPIPTLGAHVDASDHPHHPKCTGRLVHSSHLQRRSLVPSSHIFL